MNFVLVSVLLIGKRVSVFGLGKGEKKRKEFNFNFKGRTNNTIHRNREPLMSLHMKINENSVIGARAPELSDRGFGWSPFVSHKLGVTPNLVT